MKEPLFPSYRRYKIQILRKAPLLERKELENTLVQKYIRRFFMVVGFMILGFWLKAMLRSAIEDTNTYPSSKYKKVIKEGVLFTTVEYHER